MKRWFTMAIIAIGLAGLNSGCATHAGTGAVTGGAIGTGLGAVVGHATGNTGAGAVVGGLVGAGVGGAIGDEKDREERRDAAIRQAALTPPPPPRMTVHDVIIMTRQGVSDNLIINQIYSTGSVFYLSTQDVIDLHQQGVSQPVIQVMSDTARRAAVRPRTVIVERDPIYVVEPPPRVHFGVGYHFGPHCRRRCW